MEWDFIGLLVQPTDRVISLIHVNLCKSTLVRHFNVSRGSTILMRGMSVQGDTRYLEIIECLLGSRPGL
jgi:hypothetical protein